MARTTRASASTALATRTATKKQATTKASTKTAAASHRVKSEESDVSSDIKPTIKEEQSTPRKPSSITRQAASTNRKRRSTAPDPTPSAAAGKRSTKKVKLEEADSDVDEPLQLPSPSASSTDASDLSDSESESASPPPKRKAKPSTKKTSTPSTSKTDTPSTSKSTPQALRDRKLKQHTANLSSDGNLVSPFPDFAHPTHADAKLAHSILSKLHGARTRPKEVTAPTSRAGCGDSPCVLDALVRTILSQNTSDTNSTRAKRSMDAAYGGSDNWEAIANEGQGKLQEAIKCGGLSQVKSRVIISILEQVKEKYGTYSLDHLHSAPDGVAMGELLSFQGVGPKTASCVLLFCLQREDFAVDTHVYRITGLLGWRPMKANREQTYAHLNARLPGEDKYGLHILLVGHGKKCDECKAGGRVAGRCELRKAFGKGKKKGLVEDGEDVKEEDMKAEDMKEEEVDEIVEEVKAEREDD